MSNMENKTTPKTALLVISYRRPEFTFELLNSLPEDREIYIVCDGLKDESHRKDWLRNRKVVKEFQSSKPSVSVHLRQKNLGGKDGVPDAVDWSLQVQDAIIVLEDDCRPHNLFYDFCDFHLMQPHTHDLAFISGNNFITNKNYFQQPIYSKFPHCWGWATSKASWTKHRPHRNKSGTWKLKYGNTTRHQINSIKKCVDTMQLTDAISKRFWLMTFSQLISETKYHWDYCYTLNMWMSGTFALLPPINLVTNIGDDHRSLNTNSKAKSLHIDNAVSPNEVSYLFKNQGLDGYDPDFDRQISNFIWPKWKMLYHMSGPLKLLTYPIVKYLKG